MTADVQAAIRWLLSTDEFAVARIAVARAKAGFDGTRVASVIPEQETGRQSGVRSARSGIRLTGGPEAVQAAAVEVTRALHWHERGRWDIEAVLAWTPAVVAEYSWVPDTGRRQSAPTAWLLVDYLLTAATGRDPRLDPEAAAVRLDRVLPRLETAVQAAGQILTNLWARYVRGVRPVATVWPARIPEHQRLTRAFGNPDVPRAWLPQVVTAWAIWHDLPSVEADERPTADWERVALPGAASLDWPPPTVGANRSMGI